MVWLLLVAAAVLAAATIAWIRHLKAVAHDHWLQARTDTLTGLPNRLALQEALDDRLEPESSARFGVFLLDLDRFKQVNDTLGHEVGDLLLVEVARRLRSTILAGDTLARLGGDEFAIVAPSVRSANDAVAFGRLLADQLDRPFRLDGHLVEVGVSSGAALHPVHARSRSDLLRCADVAMYVAKSGGDDVAVYDPSMDHSSPEQMARAVQLRQAIALDQLHLVFQPIVDSVTRAPVRFEALARWRHPDHGLLLPVDFLHLAADQRLMGELTAWAIDRAVGHCARWVADGFDLGVAVNVFPDVLRDLAFPEQVARALRRHRLAPSRLWLEVTDHAQVTVDDRVTGVLHRLADLGVSVAIDDFGAGAWSLTDLEALPIRAVKLDHDVVQAAERSSRSLAVAETIARLMHRLDFAVVAGGIESESLATLFTGLGAQHLQGFGIGRPVSPDHVLVFARAFGERTRLAPARSGVMTAVAAADGPAVNGFEVTVDLTDGLDTAAVG